ncbi:hypothetical protein [Desulfovibrio sp. TomC]|uniref:hypothetical protein n=1 Tax=Desulfovibrio sp. TomC TaxID=1562888 RepID=UPI0012E2E4B7|nr:hypothetical protein [Desulfovibrio sp. TomC]
MESTAPKPFVFVLMPFDPEFDDVYQLGIQAACKDAGTHCERLDEQLFVEDMLSKIYKEISKADIIIADMSGKNPNVFYEVGYAHALNKTVVALTNNANDIPFDLKHFNHIVYNDSIVQLKSKLTKLVEHLVSAKVTRQCSYSSGVSFFLNGIKIHDGTTIDTTIKSTSNLFGVSLKVSLSNTGSEPLCKDFCKLGLVVPKSIYRRGESQGRRFLTSHNQNTHIIYFELPDLILPEEIVEFNIPLSLHNGTTWSELGNVDTEVVFLSPYFVSRLAFKINFVGSCS